MIAIALTSAAILPAAHAEDGAKNIILFIADGLGFNHITATNYYEHGEDSQQLYEKTFTPYAMSTYPARGKGYDPDQAWVAFNYFRAGATDSAAAATTLASGVKTLNGAIGVDRDGEHVPTIVDKAESLGKATGVVSSVQIAHATPASFVAHNKSRGKYEDIAREMIMESAVDVIMGAGHPGFGDNGEAVDFEDDEKRQRYVGGIETWAAVKEGNAGADADGDGDGDPWVLLETREAIRELMTSNAPNRVLGLAPVHETLQADRTGNDEDTTNDPPNQTPFLDTSPSLKELTAAALNVLDNNPNGLFLMVEGGAVDWASHANQAGRMIEEMIEFGDAIEEAAAWVEANSSWDETLIVITGDHECGYLTGPDSDPEWNPIANNGKGNLPGSEWHSKGHTNNLIPLFVKGAGADQFAEIANGEDTKRGSYTDNAEVGKLMIELLR
jgi:alkaline phosphatase